MGFKTLFFICVLIAVTWSEFIQTELSKIQTFAPDNKYLIRVENNVLSNINCAAICLELSWNCSTVLFQEDSNICSMYSVQLPPVPGGTYTAYVNEKGGPIASDALLVESPFNSNADLARHRCTSFTSEPPSSSCPISQRINGSWTSASVSCSVLDIFNQSSVQYEGRVTCTVSGLTCQRWDSSTPHTPSYYFGRSDIENWCRVSSEAGPWCYTTDPDVRWDYCPTEVYECDQPPPIPSVVGINVTLERPYLDRDTMAKFTCMSFTSIEPNTSCPVALCGGGDSWTSATVSCSVHDVFNQSALQYDGRVACTVNGLTCQRWDSNTPHEPSYYVGRSDLENWCRLSSELAPWCYTTDPNVRWDYCPTEVYECSQPPPIPPISGTSVKLEHPYLERDTMAKFTCTSLTSAEPITSCPIALCGGGDYWTAATVSCSVKDCFNESSEAFQGRVSCTVSGIPCQRWDSSYPHNPNYFAMRSDLENWCQLTSDTNEPWCYTTDPEIRWDYCPVDDC